MTASSWLRLKAMIMKELMAVLRDPRARMTLIAPPLIQLFLFGFAATLEVKNITLGVYDQDRGAWSREVINAAAGSASVKHLVRLDSPQAVARAIDNRDVIAVMVFDANFSRDVAAHRAAQVQVVFDGRRSNAAQIVNGYLAQIVAGVGAEISASPQVSPGSVVTNWFNPNLEYIWFTMPALIVTIAALSVLSVTSQSVARERELGTFDQLLVSPLRTYEILAGKVTPALMLGTFNATVYLLLIPNVFGVPFAGSILIFYLALFAYLIALIGIGLLVSILARSQQQAFLGMFLTTIPLIMLSGYAAPIDNMPGWLQVIAQADPLAHFLVISEGLFLKGMPLGDVLANLWPLLVIAAVALSSAALLFRSKLE